MQKPDDITFSVTAGNLDEAVAFAVNELQRLTVERKDGGFTAPEITGESFLLRDGQWLRAYDFHAEFLPAVS